MSARALVIAVLTSAGAIGAIGCASRTVPSAPASLDATPAVARHDEAAAITRPLVVFIHAEWCVACRRVAPAVAWLREEYADRVSFVEFDVTDDRALAQSTADAKRLGLGSLFATNESVTGVTILGKNRTLVHQFRVENRPGPYRSAVDAALATFAPRPPPPPPSPSP
jgi:thiol-disulfide isomerase/thioredoxin